MNTHEYQAKELLAGYGIPIPRFGVAGSRKEAKAVVEKLKLKKGVVKVQVHAGGRGKAGGVKFGNSPDEIVQLADQLIGMKLVTAQTGPEGIVAHQVIISDPADIKAEYYLGCVIDREKRCPVMIASPEGGVEIEEVAAKAPDRILTLPIEIDGRIRPFRARQIAQFMGWTDEIAKQGMKMIMGLAKAFVENDGSLLEINPLVKTPDGQLLALDAKFSIDDNALFRHPEIAAFYDPTQDKPAEVEAKKHDLSYVALDGNIGCMVNGAGLAMATMDLIQYHGGQPANFLDVGGSATKEKVTEGFKIILSDPKVKAILINIFGGIMNCATIAEGLIAAAKQLNIQVPLIVRMEGTHVEHGKELLAKSDVDIISADDLSDAAKKAVGALR